MIKIGPAGGNGGQVFGDYIVPRGGRLAEIRVYASQFIDGVQFVYRTADGRRVEMPRVGGLSGREHVFVLSQEEYLVGLNGRFGWFVDSLNIHTNRRSSTTFGGPGGEREFMLNAPPGTEIVGLFGRADWFVDALGIISRERPTGQNT